jgi:hypothetical protein
MVNDKSSDAGSANDYMREGADVRHPRAVDTLSSYSVLIHLRSATPRSAEPIPIEKAIVYLTPQTLNVLRMPLFALAAIYLNF